MIGCSYSSLLGKKGADRLKRARLRAEKNRIMIQRGEIYQAAIRYRSLGQGCGVGSHHLVIVGDQPQSGPEQKRRDRDSRPQALWHALDMERLLIFQARLPIALGD